MGRKRPSKHLRPPRPLLIGQDVQRHTVDGASFLSRSIRSGQSLKDYRCPGCNQLIRAGLGHVVVWPETPPLSVESGMDVRRHWHTSCWERS